MEKEKIYWMEENKEMIFMAKMNISIELNEQEVDELLNDEEDDEEDMEDNCCNDCGYYSDNNPPTKTYTIEEMLAANKDELTWYKQFFNKYSGLFNDITNGEATLARYDLVKRIELGERIVSNLELKEATNNILNK